MTRSTFGRGLLIAVPICLAALFAGPSPAQPKDVRGRTYVGSLNGMPGKNRIALVVEGNEILAYLCGDDPAFNKTFARWFQGPIQAGTVNLLENGIDLQATVQRDRIIGAVLAPKQTLRFVALPANDKAGLFRADGAADKEEHVGGWIVDNRGFVVGAHHYRTFEKGAYYRHVNTFHYNREHAFHRDHDFHRHFVVHTKHHDYHAHRVTHAHHHHHEGRRK